MLTDSKIRSAPPQGKAYKLYDSEGLYLLVNTNDSRWWRFKYRVGGKERGLAFGVYPEVSLVEARKRRDAARAQLAKGIDPSEHRRADKAAVKAQALDTFQVIAEEWITKKIPEWSASTLSKTRWLVNTYLYPKLGMCPVREITAPSLLACLQAIESKGLLETAGRARHRCGQILRYAVVTGRCDQDVATFLDGALQPPKTAHHAAITEPALLAPLLYAIWLYRGRPATQAALKLAPMLFVRPGELRQAEWADVDLKMGLWVVPAEIMKPVNGEKKKHVVPLPRQAVEILAELKAETGCYTHVFPNDRGCAFPMSSGALARALERSGYDGSIQTVTGFRATARTILDEILGYRPELIELQLAHIVKGPNGEAYPRMKFMEQRVAMMQVWADYLERLRIEAPVAPQNSYVMDEMKR